MKLTDLILNSANRREKVYKLYDGGGLSIEVPPRGNLRWRFKYTYLGREKRLSVGVYPETSIEVARGLRDELKKSLAEGIDPGLRRKQNKKAASTDITELSREQLIQRVLDLEEVLRHTRGILLKARDHMSMI